MKTDIAKRIREAFDFVRVRIALSLVFLAVSGYLIFNPMNANLLFVILGAFFLSCGSYGYNTITDKEEDAINSRINALAFSRIGLAAVFVSFALGILFSSFLGIIPIAISIISALTAFAYSRFRLKKYLFIKNIYTAFTVSLSFIFGAMELSSEAISYYFAFSLFFFAGSIISDLRDFNGDRRAGIRTIPVIFGEENAKRFLYVILAAILLVFSSIDLKTFLPFIFALPATYALVNKNKPKQAHLSMALSINFFVLWTAITRVIL